MELAITGSLRLWYARYVRQVALAAAVSVVLVSSVGCGSKTTRGTDPASAIERFDPSRGAIDISFARLNSAALDAPARTRAAAIARLHSRTFPERFAAVYALELSATPADRATLRSLLRSANETVRLLAAAALVQIRDAQAIPVLRDALKSRTALAFWGPPLTAAVFAKRVLLERQRVSKT